MIEMYSIRYSLTLWVRQIIIQLVACCLLRKVKDKQGVFLQMHCFFILGKCQISATTYHIDWHKNEKLLNNKQSNIFTSINIQHKSRNYRNVFPSQFFLFGMRNIIGRLINFLQRKYNSRIQHCNIDKIRFSLIAKY